MKQTGNDLDVAITGEGFMQVRRPDGSIAYTRDGNLGLDAEGNVVTHTGLRIEPDLNVPPEATAIRISQDGIVTAEFEGDPIGVELGQIELARFANEGGLEPIGGNLFEQTAASGPPTIATPGQDGMGMLRQGFLEGSNVDIVREMTNLIEAQRAYEINSKMVTTTEDMLQIANNLKR
jgi:flagellar basal-body rod protein FlgG